MNEKFLKIIEKIKSGRYSRKELETLRKNALNIGNAEIVVSACDDMLATLAQKQSPAKTKSKTPDNIAEERTGYSIMVSALDAEGHFITPELVGIAEELATNGLVDNISILKKEIRLYYKGRHLTARNNGKKPGAWLTCLDENKITAQTVARWEQLGTVKASQYFATRYVEVRVEELEKMHAVLDCIVFSE
jgi:hypothetical protein